MSGEEFDNFWLSFNGIQQKIETFKRKEKELNKKIKDYVKNYQMIESEMIILLLAMREIYSIKRKHWKKKIKKLKIRRKKYTNFLENIFEENKKIQKLNSNDIGSNQIDLINSSINKIEFKIKELKKLIQFKHLGINEENVLIENINELERKKQEYIREQQNTEHYKIQKKIKFVKINLENISTQLDKLYNKRRNSHSIILDLYRRANKIKYDKKKLENELIDIKKTTLSNELPLLKDLTQDKKISKAKKPLELKSKQMTMQEQKQRGKNNWSLLQKIKQEKLAIALKKQKAGKRLDFYEFKLILKHSKK